MNNNLSEKKAWATPTIEEAPVQITEGGKYDSYYEGYYVYNDDKLDDNGHSS